jgi:hypothetical protein
VEFVGIVLTLEFWEREALAYKQGVTTVYSEAGISSPRLLALNRRPNGDVALWLEDVHSGGDSVPGTRPSHTNGSAP